MSHEHNSDHSEDHGHGHDHAPDANALLAEALESLLVEKGLVDSARIDAIVADYEHDIGPLRGARVIARAWVDPGFKQRLLDDATTAIGELDIVDAEHKVLVAVENTPQVHNVIVCTLCSCYPWSVLGLPPTWYKDPAYRGRVVSEPRAVLGEFGLELPEQVEVRVWDSSAEVRYIVVPERPPGTEALSEEELVQLVGRDSMIGTARAGQR